MVHVHVRESRKKKKKFINCDTWTSSVPKLMLPTQLTKVHESTHRKYFHAHKVTTAQGTQSIYFHSSHKAHTHTQSKLTKK